MNVALLKFASRGEILEARIKMSSFDVNEKFSILFEYCLH